MAGLIVGCGKKGPPLPPLQRVPAAPPDLTTMRMEEEVYARFAVPAVNVDGARPADVARVEVYAITADRPPDVTDAEQLREISTLVASQLVRRPLPELPPPKESMPPIPLPPPGPGVDQGVVVVVREPLTPDSRKPVAVPEPEGQRREPETATIAWPLGEPASGGGPKRYYYAVAVSTRGRYGPLTGLVPAPLGPTSSAPPAPEVTIDEKSMTIRWKPPVDARGVSELASPELLPSRSLVPGPPPTTYDVYEVAGTRTEEPTEVTMPVPLNEAPVAALELTRSGITLGTERCFVVRPVDIVDGIHVRGPASPMVCASFADTFAPSPPGGLVAVASAGMIGLLWEPSDAADVTGYVVLRGDAGGATLAPLTAEAVSATTYRDESVQPGVRYVYAVVAIDRAGNRSVESNRVEETARQELQAGSYKLQVPSYKFWRFRL